MFDGERIWKSADVLVCDGRIEDISRSISRSNQKLAKLNVIDGRGFTLLPGFIDTHTESVSQLANVLVFGVTTVLDMGTFPEHEPALHRIAAKRCDITDFRSSGIFITAPSSLSDLARR